MCHLYQYLNLTEHQSVFQAAFHNKLLGLGLTAKSFSNHVSTIKLIIIQGKKYVLYLKDNIHKEDVAPFRWGVIQLKRSI